MNELLDAADQNLPQRFLQAHGIWQCPKFCDDHIFTLNAREGLIGRRLSVEAMSLAPMCCEPGSDVLWAWLAFSGRRAADCRRIL